MKKVRPKHPVESFQLSKSLVVEVVEVEAQENGGAWLSDGWCAVLVSAPIGGVATDVISVKAATRELAAEKLEATMLSVAQLVRDLRFAKIGLPGAPKPIAGRSGVEG